MYLWFLGIFWGRKGQNYKLKIDLIVGFVRKLRPKPIHQIDPRTGSASLSRWWSNPETPSSSRHAFRSNNLHFGQKCFRSHFFSPEWKKMHPIIYLTIRDNVLRLRGTEKTLKTIFKALVLQKKFWNFDEYWFIKLTPGTDVLIFEIIFAEYFG
jgi:hypothetical protein